MARIETIRIEHGGRTWSGSYTLEGDEVSVASAYGSERVKVGRRKPNTVAEAALAKIVSARQP